MSFVNFCEIQTGSSVVERWSASQITKRNPGISDPIPINRFVVFQVKNTASQCNLSGHTAIEWYSFCCEVCEKVVANDKTVGGQFIVELDKSNLVKRMQHRGHLLEFCNTLRLEEFVRDTGEIF